MDMRLDKARRNEPTAEIDRFPLRCELGFDGDDLAVLDSDVGDAAIGINELRALENEVHGVSPSRASKPGPNKFGIAVPRALASAHDNASSEADMIASTLLRKSGHDQARARMAENADGPLAVVHPQDASRTAIRSAILMGEADDEIAEEAVGGEAKRAKAYDADEDLVRCHPEARVEYQVAKAGIRRDHFGGHHGCERIAHGKAHAGQDERQRRRQCHKNEYLEGSGAKASRGAQLVRSDMRHADHGVDEHDEDRRIDDDENFRSLPDAEPDDHRGQPCQRGHETKELYIGVEDRADDGN